MELTKILLTGALLASLLGCQHKDTSSNSYATAMAVANDAAKTHNDTIAARSYARAHAILPKSPEPLYHLGDLSMKRGEWVKSTALFNEAIMRHPNQPTLYKKLSESYYRQGQYVPAIRALIDEFALLPRSNINQGSQIMNDLGVMASQLNNVKVAECCYRTALILSPGDESVQQNLFLTRHVGPIRAERALPVVFSQWSEIKKICRCLSARMSVRLPVPRALDDHDRSPRSYLARG